MDDGPGPLPWRVGGVIGFTVDAAAFPDGAEHRLEVYLRLRPATIARLAAGRTHTGEMRIDLKLRPGRKGKVQEASREIRITPADTSGGFGRVLVFPFRVHPGTHRLTVKMEAQRHVLPGTGAGRFESVSVDGEFTVPPPQAGRDISDIEFLWTEPESTGAASDAFTRGGVRRLPNPERLYGLFESTMHASVFAVVPADSGSRLWHWVARATNAKGEIVAQRETTAAASPTLNADLAFDLSTEPAGEYQLEVKAWQEGDAGALLRRARFSLGWSLDTWARDPRDLDDEVHLLLAPENEERFSRMLPGEQERFLTDFWRDRDPTPETARNEALDLYLSRVDHANHVFSRSLDRGMFTDMGRVYIRLGAPSEVQHEVIPGRDNELARVIRQYVTVNDRPIGDIGDNTPGADMRPFEVWVYEGEISVPLSANFKYGATRHLRKPIVFLFVDDRWVGDYRLRYSTE